MLSPMFEIAPEDVVVGRHGLMVSYEGRRGLLLPQVAPEWGWDRETLLAQTCRKAGLAQECGSAERSSKRLRQRCLERPSREKVCGSECPRFQGFKGFKVRK